MDKNNNEQVFTENSKRPWGVALSVWESFPLPEDWENMTDAEFEDMIKWL